MENIYAGLNKCTIFLHFRVEKVKTCVDIPIDQKFFRFMLFESILHTEPNQFFAHNTCKLVIFFQKKRIYFCMLGPEKEILYCKEYYNKNQATDLLFYRYAFEQESSLSHTYASIKVYVDADFCLIPDQKEFILKRNMFARFLLNEDIEDQEIYYHPITPSQVAGLFVPSQLWVDILNEFLPRYELSNSSELLLRLAELLNPGFIPLLLIQVLDQHVNLLGFKNDQLQFIQRYEYHSELDLVYFIQLASSILNNGGSVDQYLFGEIQGLDQESGNLRKYFPKIKFPLNLKLRQGDSAQGDLWWKYAYLV